MRFWASEASVKLRVIQPDKPRQAAFMERFKGERSRYCLELPWLASIDDARSTIDNWRGYYNRVRPHRSLGKKLPAVFAMEAA